MKEGPARSDAPRVLGRRREARFDVVRRLEDDRSRPLANPPRRILLSRRLPAAALRWWFDPLNWRAVQPQSPERPASETVFATGIARRRGWSVNGA